MILCSGDNKTLQHKRNSNYFRHLSTGNEDDQVRNMCPNKGIKYRQNPKLPIILSNNPIKLCILTIQIPIKLSDKFFISSKANVSTRLCIVAKTSYFLYYIY